MSSRDRHRRDHDSGLDSCRKRYRSRSREAAKHDRRSNHSEGSHIRSRSSSPQSHNRDRRRSSVSSNHKASREDERDLRLEDKRHRRDKNGRPFDHVHKNHSPRNEDLKVHSISRDRAPLPDQKIAFANETPNQNPVDNKQKPNLAPSGLLAAAANTVKDPGSAKAVVLKYHEPPDARQPNPQKAPWQCFVFKGASADPLDTIDLYTRSSWLLGRETLVVDYATEHPSCSKQHAVLQFRYTEKAVSGGFGEKKGRIRLYVIDLESANGTKLNGDAVPAGRYVEVRKGDILRFGESEREYVLMLP